MDEHQAKRAIGVQVEVARRFAAEHWPHHNAKQGIAWEQTDHALAEYDGDACIGVAIYTARAK